MPKRSTFVARQPRQLRPAEAARGYVDAHGEHHEYIVIVHLADGSVLVVDPADAEAIEAHAQGARMVI
jgi:hypothetical protein